MDVGMYKSTVTINSCLFEWNANVVFVPKPAQVYVCLIFKNDFIYENILTSYTKTATMVYDLLSIC